MSVSVLQCFHPALLKSVSPLSVEARNCLYRSASLSVCGKLDYHVLIRLMVSLELILNRSHYTSLPELSDVRLVTSDIHH